MTIESIGIIVTALATTLGVVIAVEKFLESYKPCPKKDCIVENQSKSLVVITHIECVGCTLAEIRRTEQGGFSEDSGKTFLPLNKTMMCGDTFELIPKEVYVNGEKWDPCLEVIRKKWPPFNSKYWYIRVIPISKKSQ